MKRKAIIPLVLGLAIGLLAVKFGVDAVRRAQAVGQAHKTIKVVQAKADINAFDQIRPEMVEMTETFDSPLVPPNERISELQKVIGRVSSKSIPKGSPVLLTMLAPEGTPPGLTGRIPTGFRACSVKIDEVTGVAYQLKPGDWVDVIVVMDVETGRRGKKETVAEVILQHIQVAAVGYDATADQGDKNLKVKPAKSATLLVAEQDVPKLHLAGTRGKITLAMRGDQDTTKTAPAIAYGTEMGVDKAPEEPVAPPTKPSDSPISQWQMLASQQPQLAQAPGEPTPVMVFRGRLPNGPPLMEQITFDGPNSPKIVEMSQGAPSRAAATLRGLNVRNAQPGAAPPVVPAGESEDFGPEDNDDSSQD